MLRRDACGANNLDFAAVAVCVTNLRKELDQADSFTGHGKDKMFMAIVSTPWE